MADLSRAGDRLWVRSDRITLPSDTLERDHGTFTAVHTPQRRDFVYGNVVRAHRPVAAREVDDWLERWRTAFGGVEGVERVVVEWAISPAVAAGGGGEPELVAAAEDRRLELDADDVLLLDRPGVPAPAVAVEIRPVGAREWPLLTEWIVAQGPQEQADLWRWRAATYRALVERGVGAWWLGWHAGQPVVSAGLFAAGGVARFQLVHTAPEHRGRGLATALVTTMCAAYRRRRPGDAVVIVAERGSGAARLYRRAGFRPVETAYALTGAAEHHRPRPGQGVTPRRPRPA